MAQGPQCTAPPHLPPTCPAPGRKAGAGESPRMTREAGEKRPRARPPLCPTQTDDQEEGREGALPTRAAPQGGGVGRRLAGPAVPIGAAACAAGLQGTEDTRGTRHGAGSPDGSSLIRQEPQHTPSRPHMAGEMRPQGTPRPSQCDRHIRGQSEEAPGGTGETRGVGGGERGQGWGAG